MKYLELHFLITPDNEAAGDVLAALLADAGCETFVPTDEGLTAYVQQAFYDEEAIGEAIKTTRAAFPEPPSIDFYSMMAPDENWNATWEAEHHFEPILLPNGEQVCIVPRQAFGSGEHETTRLMLSMLTETDEKGIPFLSLSGWTVIDAGCGTGILGIAALKLGAAQVFAYDIDEWSVRNASENYSRNGLQATIVEGDASVLATAPKADLLLANINRNILLADLPAFADSLKPAGHLLLSGFYEADVTSLTQAASTLGLRLLTSHADGDWRALHFCKS